MKFAKQDVSDRDSKSSDSDFDEDDDPDKIEVPGGGKDLATAYTIVPQEERQIKKENNVNNSQNVKEEETKMQKRAGSDNMKNKIPAGLVMKDVSPGYEMIRTGASYNPLQSTANMLGALGFPPTMGFNAMPSLPPQFLQQSLEMAGFTGGLADPSLLYSNMGGLNPLMLQGNGSFMSHFLSQKAAAFHPNQQNWNALNNKALSQIWMNTDFKMPMTTAEEEDNEDEDMGVAETYADYMPPKCKLILL